MLISAMGCNCQIDCVVSGNTQLCNWECLIENWKFHIIACVVVFSHDVIVLSLCLKREKEGGEGGH